MVLRLPRNGAQASHLVGARGPSLHGANLRTRLSPSQIRQCDDTSQKRRLASLDVSERCDIKMPSFSNLLSEIRSGGIMKLKAIVASCAALSLAACATSPDKISAAYVSPLQYQSYDCGQIRMELVRIGQRVDEVTGQQRRQASNDAWAMGVGLVLFWPALFFLAGGNDKKEELGRLKGEYDALQSAAVQKQCMNQQASTSAYSNRTELTPPTQQAPTPQPQ